MISRVRSGCSNISTLRDCDVQSVTQRGVASSGTPRPVGSLSTVVWSVRASTTSIIRYALREETLAPLAGGFALARGSQRGIELEVGPGAWRRKPLHGARAAQRELQENARRLQPEAPLRDAHIEIDEMFQNAGEKGERHLD